MAETKDQIAAMLGSAIGDPEAAEEVVEEVEDVEAAAPVFETEEVEEPNEAEESDGSESKTIAQLREEIERLSRQVAEAKEAKQNQEAEPAAVPASFQLTKEEVEAASYDSEKMYELLMRVYEAARQDTLTAMPQLVNVTVNRQQAIASVVNDFYNKNPQLKDHAGYVGFVTNQVQSEHPDWSVAQILDEAAKRAMTTLNLHATAKKREEDRLAQSNEKNKPAFAKAPKASAQRTAFEEERSDLQRQLSAMLKSVS